MTIEEAAAAALVAAIHSGDVDAVQRLVADTPELAGGPLDGPFKTRSALHVVTDWPGYFPNGAQVVATTSMSPRPSDNAAPPSVSSPPVPT